ncbi:MAG: hypothetical protein GY757_50190 [bacterium]|nr:hypothetical protein [bacterium]
MTYIEPEDQKNETPQVKDTLLGILCSFIANGVLIGIVIIINMFFVSSLEGMLTSFILSVLIIGGINLWAFIYLKNNRKDLAIGWGLMVGIGVLPLVVFGLCVGVIG